MSHRTVLIEVTSKTTEKKPACLEEPIAIYVNAPSITGTGRGLELFLFLDQEIDDDLITNDMHYPSVAFIKSDDPSEFHRFTYQRIRPCIDELAYIPIRLVKRQAYTIYSDHNHWDRNCRRKQRKKITYRILVKGKNSPST